MIDYHAHVAAVAATKDVLSLAVAAGESPEEAQSLSDAIDQNLPLAWLGSCVDALVSFADPGSSELELLTRTGDLWQRALALHEELGTARIEFELALLRDDLEDPLGVLNMGINRLETVRNDARDMKAELEAVRAEIATLEHLPLHPRQEDRPSADWRWSDAFAGRRSWAFVRAMFAGAADDRSTALAVGALAGYAGNVAGSAYLGHTVGGPRRLHRFRDRLARNSLGAWIHDRAGTPPPGELAARIVETVDPQRQDPPELASEIAQHIKAALVSAFPTRSPVDVQFGFRRMIDHLERLEGFRMPEPPEPPPIILGADGTAVKIEASVFDPGLKPRDLDGPGTGTGAGVPSTGPSTEPDKASGSKGSCGILAFLIALILFVVAYVIWCIVRTAEGRTCAVEDYFAAFDAGEEPDPREPGHQTQEALTIMRQPENSAHLINDLFEAQMKLWQGLEAARSSLILHGLIYPETGDLKSKVHSQFFVAFDDVVWPRSAVVDPESSFERYPMTSAEQGVETNPFPWGRGPEWLLEVNFADNEGTFSEIALEGFRNLQRGDDDVPNLDLDADRGRRHACWQVADGTSINDPVLAVSILPVGSE